MRKGFKIRSEILAGDKRITMAGKFSRMQIYYDRLTKFNRLQAFRLVKLSYLNGLIVIQLK